MFNYIAGFIEASFEELCQSYLPHAGAAVFLLALCWVNTGIYTPH